ncbi:MAG: beta-ketoacyl-[acyl-carrier-protein] synthase family protein, partial [Propionivibrio sp.]|uniref:beta-ketoacyl-[acyl-carrier-protein] synthase family protein n=1 Tax=Propionivibrio sp. TaxID=2212460 RepID=UPI001A610EA3
MRRVAVTGMGMVSPLGNTLDEAYSNAYFGRSAINRLDLPLSHRLLAPLAATVRFAGADHFAPPKLRMLDRVSQFALVAANQSLVDSGCDLRQLDPDRAGVFVGTGMGGSQSNDEGYKTLYGDNSDRIKPFTVLMGMHNAPSAWIGIEHALRGPNLTYSTACSSSAVAIGEAWLRVANGSLDLAIAGGAEAPLSFGSLKAWEALHTLASIDEDEPSASCKPFSKNRSGMVLGEGAAMLILEPWDHALARGAPIHGELLGYGLMTDAAHITRPTAEGQAMAMRAALQSALIEPSAVDAINAHGTGTQANDSVETAAIKAVFGERAYHIPISATKALHGHLLG